MITQWFMLPGMGATSAMYDALIRELPFQVNFINWPGYRGEKTYAVVAQRIIIENRIHDDSIVGGSSLGGMVALEIAQLIKPKAVILLGSAINAGEVQSLLAALSPVAAITPIALVQALASKHGNLVSTMFSECNPDFIRAMCLYLRLWQGYGGSKNNIFRLHGRQDHIIPCPTDKCDIIESAGHLLAITHVRETAAFLNRVSSQIGAPSRRCLQL